MVHRLLAVACGSAISTPEMLDISSVAVRFSYLYELYYFSLQKDVKVQICVTHFVPLVSLYTPYTV